MKEKYLIITILLVPTILLGQQAGIRVGIGAGNLYTLDKGFSEVLPRYKYAFSFSADLSLWNKLSDKVYFVPAIGISSISTTYENPFDLVGQEKGRDRLNLFYLKSPLRLCFAFNKLMPHIGPSFGYLIQHKVKLGEEDNFVYPHVLSNKFDFGLDLGLGLKLSNHILAGLNLYNGFGNVEKIECGNCSTSKAQVSKIRTFEFYLNYFFDK